MNKHIFLLFPLGCAWAAQAADLTLEVAVPPLKQGTVMAAVFDTAEGFPRGSALRYAAAEAVNGRAVLRLTELPAGDYAVSAFLDENANKKLDSNLFGIPTEPYGFSRNARNAMGPPSFADAVFRVDGTLVQAIELK